MERPRHLLIAFAINDLTELHKWVQKSYREKIASNQLSLEDISALKQDFADYNSMLSTVPKDLPKPAPLEFNDSLTVTQSVDLLEAGIRETMAILGAPLPPATTAPAHVLSNPHQSPPAPSRQDGSIILWGVASVIALPLIEHFSWRADTGNLARDAKEYLPYLTGLLLVAWSAIRFSQQKIGAGIALLLFSGASLALGFSLFHIFPIHGLNKVEQWYPIITSTTLAWFIARAIAFIVSKGTPPHSAK